MKITPQIFFFTEDIDFTLDNSKSIEEVLVKYIFEAGNQCDEINYIFCSDEFLLKLNKEYLDHDFYTDILSFQMGDDPVQGDIYISIDRVRENASVLSLSFHDELYRVIAHGVLHFLGNKDKTDDEKKIMRAKEDEVIELIKKRIKKGDIKL